MIGEKYVYKGWKMLTMISFAVFQQSKITIWSNLCIFEKQFHVGLKNKTRMCDAISSTVVPSQAGVSGFWKNQIDLKKNQLMNETV